MAQSVRYKLTENEEMGIKNDHVTHTMYTDVQNLTQSVAKNIGRTKNGIVAKSRKFHGLGVVLGI